MKSRFIVAALPALLLQGCSNAPESAAAPAAEATVSGVKAATTTGTIRSIDARIGLVSVAHEAVESLGWPAMVMPFKATPEQLAGLKVGQKVRVEFEAQDMNATVTKISPGQ